MTMTIPQWGAWVRGRWVDNNESGIADCTDVPKSLHEECTGTSWESAGMYGDGGNLAGNCSARWYDVRPFSSAVDYPTGTVFSAWVPGSKYGHTGVLSHVYRGVWQAWQQDTGLNRPCWLGPVLFTPHTVAIPRYAVKPGLPGTGGTTPPPTPKPIDIPEDDMPLTDNDIDRVVNRMMTAQLATNWGSLTLPELIMKAAEQAALTTLTMQMQTNVGSQSLADLTVSARQRLDELARIDNPA